MPRITTGPITRPPTSEEAARFEKWRGKVHKGRRSMESLLAGAHALSLAEQWRRANAPQVAPCFTEADGLRVIELADKWNRMEAALSSVELEHAAIRMNGADLDVYDLPGIVDTGPTEGLGLIPLILIVVGIALIVGAIVYTDATELEIKREDMNLKKKLADISATMAKAPPDQRAAWKSFLDSSPFKEEKSIWDKLGDTLSSGAGLVLLILAAGLMMGAGKGAGSSPAPQTNPRRRRVSARRNRAIMYRAAADVPGNPYRRELLAKAYQIDPTLRENPCHAGGGGSWSAPRSGGSKGLVKWSDDPEKRARQATYIEAYYYGSPDVKKWVAERRRKGSRIREAVEKAALPRGTYRLEY